MYRRILPFFLFLTLCHCLQAQQPSHYIIGEEELSGVNIFSIAQGEDGSIWLSTNMGLVKYNGYEFKNITSQESGRKSLFELRKDNRNNLYCCNLSGQIFQIKNDTLRLFYQIPDSILSDYIQFNFDDQNRLVFCTKGYYVVEEDQNPRFLFPSKYANTIAKTPSDELVLLDEETQRMALFKEDKIQYTEELPIYANRPFLSDSTICLGLFMDQKPVLTCRNQGNWNKIEFESNSFLQQNAILETHLIGDSLIALFDKTKGASFYHFNGDLKYHQANLFSRYRISGHLIDHEGNLWLSTLGKGLIVIPNPEIIDFKKHPLLADDDLKTICADSQGRIYVAGLEGKIYQIDGQQLTLFKETAFEIENLSYSENMEALLFDRKMVLMRDGAELGSNASSVKDICIVDSGIVLYATNIGIVKADFTQYPGKDVLVEFLTDTRSHCLAHNPNNSSIWLGSSVGLQRLQNDEVLDLEYQGSPIFATDIEYLYGEIWVSTQQNGILIFDSTLEGRAFNFTQDLNIQFVNQIRFDKHKLYFTSDAGFHSYDLESQTGKLLSISDGLLSDRIIDFEIVGHTAWIIFPDGLQMIPLNRVSKNVLPPPMNWKAILINGENVNNQVKPKLSHWQNQFEFQFVAPTFRHRGKLTYRYKLEGMDEDWNTQAFEDNSVMYQSLPPGKYKFHVKAINENGIESETLSYAFSIKPPFWLSWWFIILIALVLIGLGATYFLIRLNIVKKQLTLEKQLKISEIKAIKAQMNPHFVFNALNSIQDLIIQKDVRASNIYLGKFSDLMRKTLDYSSKNFISLSEEIEMLELYLSIEKLRFGNDFDAMVHCDIEAQKRQELQVPSMLIQPYVENAIKHGLLHKSGLKKLSIRFYLEQQSLLCEIEDNGIGRKRSTEIKERRARSHASFSTEANKKRIDLIRESTNMRISLEIIDLEENDRATGTKVVLKFR